jgi:threonyl-tRNA synthetase
MEGIIKVTLPDGSQREYPVGSTALDVATSISEGLARNVLAAKVNNLVQDAMCALPAQCQLQLLTWNDADGKSTLSPHGRGLRISLSRG